MDTKHLHVFIQVAEAGSVQGAARKLGIPRSAVRRCIDELEADVGAALLHRDPSGVRLTPAGLVVLEDGKRMLGSARNLVASARSAQREGWGTLRAIEPVGMPLAIHVHALLATHLAFPKQRLVIRHVEDPLSNLNEPFELLCTMVPRRIGTHGTPA